MNNTITDKKLIYYIINHYIDTRKLLRKLGIDVRANNSMFCPFHDNTNTPAAHLYKEQDGSHTIYCYSEDRLFHNTDLYKTYLPEINLQELANLLYNNLSADERLKVTDNVNVEFELEELPFNSYMVAFRHGKITYQDLLNGINETLPQDDTIRLMDLIYNMGDKPQIKSSNKYVYFMNHYESDYRFISSIKLLINFGNTLPGYFVNYLQQAGDSIMLPNKINNTIYSITFRNINGQKQFIKMGARSSLFYNLGNLPKDFKYGTPIILVEGNIDCDSVRQIYPCALATLTNAISLNQLQLLSALTNKVIIAYDNDEAGKRGYWNAYNTLTKRGFRVKRFKHSCLLKDFGDLIDLQMRDKEDYESTLLYYKRQIQNLLEDLM